MASITVLNPASAAPHGGPAPIRVVLLGLGTVGTGVYQLLAQRPDVFDIRRVVVRRHGRQRDVAVPRELLSTNLWDAINEPADLVIELVGGGAPVGDVVHAALLAGRTVVSANKALVARRWRQFARFTSGVDRTLRFSAAVGGEVPVLETLEDLAARDTITGVRGVVNGTCNFVLDQLEHGASLAAAVAQAQELGFAEADPRGDLSGEDAAYKLELIARTAFRHCATPRFAVSGIDHLAPETVRAARDSGRRIRLVASCVLDASGVQGTVQTQTLDAADYLAQAAGEENRLEILAAHGEPVRLSGKGAGRWPTARSVLSDVHAHLRAQLSLASSRREQHAHRFEAVERLLENELAPHQAVVAGE